MYNLNAQVNAMKFVKPGETFRLGGSEYVLVRRYYLAKTDETRLTIRRVADGTVDYQYIPGRVAK